MNDSKDQKAAAEPPLDCWVGRNRPVDEPIISVQHEKTESGWMVSCHISCLATEGQAITVENVLMDLLCSKEIEKQ